MSIKNIDINQVNAQVKLAGIKRCEEAGIDYIQHRHLFPLMAENDIPLINRLPNLEGISNTNEMWLLEDNFDDWNSLKELYDQIDLTKQTKESGRDIIVTTKELVARFDKIFQALVVEARQTNTVPPIPSELFELRDQILFQAERYKQEVPAYVAYREVGRFELDPDGRRGYQLKETEINKKKLIALEQAFQANTEPRIDLPRR